jgi:mannose-6-phosphate isomerase-like protein (cupin superfamily)
MSDSRPVVVRPGEAVAAPAQLAIRHHLDRDGRWIGWSGWTRNEAGDRSGWHHHAANETYVYVIGGTITIEFGPEGTESVEAGAGDFLVVPPNTVHRETTGADVDLEAFLVRVGGEPEHVDVHGPDGARR